MSDFGHDPAIYLEEAILMKSQFTKCPYHVTFDLEQ